jgi:hypothetical protein
MEKEKQEVKFDLALQRSVLGPKHNLKTVEDDWWFKPRKYSIEGKDEINTIISQNRKQLPSELVHKIKDCTDKDGKVNIQKLLSSVSIETITLLMEYENSEDVNLFRCVLRYGIGEHNFFGEPSKEVPEDLISKLVDATPVALELFEVIQGFNPPLQRSSNEK